LRTHTDQGAFSRLSYAWVSTSRVLVALVGWVLCLQTLALASDPADQVCPRFGAGSVVSAPVDLSSQNGSLEVTFKLFTTVDAQGLVRYCYITDTGAQAPTLHVFPGDQLIIHLQNQLPVAKDGMHHALHAPKQNDDADCALGAMNGSATNLHFHGLNLPPACHQDEVVHTLVGPTESLDYQIQIPPDEPPGLYWYHPHPHGFSANQVRGGATGALIVEGIENVVPNVSGLTQRALVLRDQLAVTRGAGAPAGDISVNFVPITYPDYVPATLQTAPSQKEFWRVLNSASFTIFDLQYLINGVPQPLEVVAIDGVPVGGMAAPQSLTETDVQLPPGARAEFVVTTPNVGDQAQLVTLSWDSGPDGISYPARPIANVASQGSLRSQAKPARQTGKPVVRKSRRFAHLRDTNPTAERTLYFSENLQPPPGAPPAFFITVDGQTPAVFDMSQSPNIVVQRGSVENWTIENRSNEDHVFHIHQIHFQVLEVNGQAVDDTAIRDTVRIPYWTGSGPYPSVKLSMDFRDPNISGTFVYHCHILDHEDLGMMGEIQVLPTPIETDTSITTSSTHVNVNESVTVTAAVTSAPYSGAPLTGTVQFAVDGISSGSAIAVANAQAAFTTVFATGGNHTITAIYSGDANYHTSTSSALVVSADGFLLTASSPIVSGGAATATITVTSSGGFNSAVDVTCTVPSTMAAGSCSVSPATLTGGGQTTLTVNAHASRAQNRRPGNGVGAAMTAMFACLLMLVIPSRKLTSPIRLTLLLAACLLVNVSCTDSQWHESGTYNVTVTGVGNSNGSTIQNTVTVPVTFQ